jgi:hypothetical protein
MATLRSGRRRVVGQLVDVSLSRSADISYARESADRLMTAHGRRFTVVPVRARIAQIWSRRDPVRVDAALAIVLTVGALLAILVGGMLRTTSYLRRFSRRRSPSQSPCAAVIRSSWA